MEINFKVDFDNVQEIDKAINILTAIRQGNAQSAPVKSKKPVADITVEEPIHETGDSVDDQQADTTDEQHDINIQDLRELVSKNVKEHKNDIKDKLKELGADNVSSLDVKHYAAFHQFLTDL